MVGAEGICGQLVSQTAEFLRGDLSCVFSRFNCINSDQFLALQVYVVIFDRATIPLSLMVIYSESGPRLDITGFELHIPCTRPVHPIEPLNSGLAQTIAPSWQNPAA